MGATTRREPAEIPAGQPGFDEAGGAEGTGADFMAAPEGDLELAKEYVRKAGYESGMYDGKPLPGVSDNATQQKNMTQVAVAQFEKLGFKVEMRYVTRDSMYTKFCQVPSSRTYARAWDPVVSQSNASWDLTFTSLK